MKLRLTKDLKIQFLGITPYLEDKTGILTPQQIVSLSALLTFKGKSIKKLLQESIEKGENLEKKVQRILINSSLRGHASIATTPSLCLAFEGSKFLDSVLSGIIFSSSLMASGRRTQTTVEDIVYPTEIFYKKRAKKIYEKVSKENIDVFNYLISQKVSKGETSKILQYGIYGTGIIQLPIESIISLKREYEIEKKWMPEEVCLLLKKIEKKSAYLGFNWLYATRYAAPRNAYPYPNIFKNPAKSNIVRELIKKEKLLNGTKLISMNISATPGLKKDLIKIQKRITAMAKSFSRIKKYWFEILLERGKILRDYNLALSFQILSSIPWRVWGEKKRHRTVPMVIESIYYCIQRAAKIFRKLKAQIKQGKIDEKVIAEIETVFSIPPTVRNNPEFLQKYLNSALNSFNCYTTLIKLKIKPSSAIFVIPRAVKIDILQEYDLYNLLTGYYPLRLCSTAEEEMRRFSLKEAQQIKRALNKRGFSWLTKLVGPKCEGLGFCPEEKSCGNIKSLVKNYSEKFHKEMKEDLKKRFQNNLSLIYK